MVGEAWNADFSRERAVFWNHHNSANINLGALGPRIKQLEAQGINDRGKIVGRAFNSDGSIEHAVLWKHAGALTIDLNDVIPAHSGWLLLQAVAINRSGMIAGDGLINGDTHGFVLIPRDH